MITLSLCMIVKNEQKNICRCLDNIKEVVDEIIIVDTGSTDETKKLAKKYTDKIYDMKWQDDFSLARNYSFEKATKEYIMWIDADEYMTKEQCLELKKLKENINEEIDGIKMLTYIQLKNNKPKIQISRIRVVKNSINYKWIGYVHEYIKLKGNVYESNISIIHDKENEINDRNLNIYINNINKGFKLSNRDLFYYGKELYYNKFYKKAIKVLEEFININT